MRNKELITLLQEQDPEDVYKRQLIAVILAGFLLINEKRKHPWEK